MKKLSIKDIIEFRGKSDRGKKNFAAALKIDKKEAETEGGGDYWISCLAAISNSFKSNGIQPIIDKRHELETKYEETEYQRTKMMYKRNIDILYNFEDLDLNRWRPKGRINFLKKHKSDSILSINGFQIQVTPHHVFSFQKNNVKEVGAIWFVAKLEGLRIAELGMFTDVLHLYLKNHFSEQYTLNSNYCIAVDAFNNVEINCSQLEQGEIPRILNLTLKEINDLM